MKETKQLKEHKTPQFQIVKIDEQNKVFFAASGTPGPNPKNPGATLSSIGCW